MSFTLKRTLCAFVPHKFGPRISIRPCMHASNQKYSHLILHPPPSWVSPPKLICFLNRVKPPILDQYPHRECVGYWNFDQAGIAFWWGLNKEIQFMPHSVCAQLPHLYWLPCKSSDFINLVPIQIDICSSAICSSLTLTMVCNDFNSNDEHMAWASRARATLGRRGLQQSKTKILNMTIKIYDKISCLYHQVKHMQCVIMLG